MGGGEGSHGALPLRNGKISEEENGDRYKKRITELGG